MSSQPGGGDDGDEPRRKITPWKPAANFPYGRIHSRRIPFHAPDFANYKPPKRGEARRRGESPYGDRWGQDEPEHRRAVIPDGSRGRGGQDGHKRGQARPSPSPDPGNDVITHDSHATQDARVAFEFGHDAEALFKEYIEGYSKAYADGYAQALDRPAGDPHTQENSRYVWEFGLFGKRISEHLMNLFLKKARLNGTPMGVAFSKGMSQHMNQYKFDFTPSENERLAPAPAPVVPDGDGGAQVLPDGDEEGPALPADEEEGPVDRRNVLDAARRRADAAAQRFRAAARRVKLPRLPFGRAGPRSAPPSDDIKDTDQPIRKPSPAIQAAARRRLESMGYKTRRPPSSGSPVTV